MKPTTKNAPIKHIFCVLTFLGWIAGSAQAGNYDPNWSKNDCDAYSHHGVGERYVFGGDMGWTDNNHWDSSGEGVDCSSYVPRCLQIPSDDLNEGQSGNHPYSTGGMYPNGLPHTDKVNSAMNLETWDFFVWRGDHGGPSTGHTGLIANPGGSCTTREALCTDCGVIQQTRSRQYLIDANCNYYRRSQWGGGKPDRPTSLTASATSWSHIDLRWTDNSSNENGFEVQKSNVGPDSGFNFERNVADGHTCTISSLNANNTYWFRVRAFNGEGNSDWSNVAHDTTFANNPPAAPSNLTATAVNDDKITLTWTDNSSNEDQFNINQSTDGVTWTLIKETNPDVTTFDVTGLAGNRTYYFRVKAMNTAGPSDYSNTASDTTGPTAPSNLNAVPNAKDSSKVKLTWTDNSGAEAGFKIERSLSSGSGFSQIATNAANLASYTDTGLSANTTYYYRVRGYNANANSMFSNTDDATTISDGPVLAVISDRTVAATSNLSFTNSSTDPNKSVTSNEFQSFAGYADGTAGVTFRAPDFSGTTSAFIDYSVTNWANVVSSFPAGQSGVRVYKAKWNFKTSASNPWILFSTKSAPNDPNPTINFNQAFSVRIYTSKDLKVGLGIRETGTTANIGNDGGDVGDMEYIGVTNLVSGTPMPTRLVTANTWTTLTWNIPFEPVTAFTGGNGVIDGTNVPNKGVCAFLALVAAGGNGQYTVHVDSLTVVTTNTLTYSLNSPPAGATINSKTGVFSWTPTSGQAGLYTISVTVADQLSYTDTKTFKVTVTSAANNPPNLAAIGNKTVSEGSALTFTATATDPDGGQTKTFSLDSGNPSGSSINSSSGAFTWTPTEAQGAGSYPITVRVTDNGSPASNDFETITVTVDEINVAPALATIANQTVTEGSTFSYTASATDSDLPANTLTYSLITAPTNMTINPSSGAISWTTAEKDGPATNQITVRVKDNGVPVLWSDKTFNLTVNEANVAPVLTVTNSASTTVDLVDYENYQDGSYNGSVMFRQPSYSGSTSSFLDSALADLTSVTTNSPLPVQSSVLQASFAFKTGQTNPWLRLTTFSSTSSGYSLPNPTIDSGKHLQFDIYSDKSIKICLGIRETGIQAPLGDDGGTSGDIEFVGATGKNGAAPICTRTITANTWTTLDFDLPNESTTAFTGNGILAPGKSVLENLAVVPNGGTGIHNIYVDNFKVYSSSTNFTVNTGEEITLVSTATDADLPVQTLTFSLDAGAPTNAVISENGVFSWIPTPEQSPSTNVITIRVTDNGPGNLSAAQAVTIKVVKVNTPPGLTAFEDDIKVENGTGATATVDVEAWDDDLPAQNLTFSLTSAPAGATIGASTGTFTWTPPAGLSTNLVIVRVTDDGVPPLYSEQQFSVKVVTSNTAPTLSLGTARISEPIVNYETFTNNTPNGNVMFKSPSFANTTTNFIDLTVTNYCKITNSFPTGNTNSDGSRTLVAKWNFKTGTSDYWVRLTTTNTTFLPNPTIDLGARLRFDINSSKSLKVGLGVRETGGSAEIGANGGTTGGIEWLGVTNKVGSSPIPNRAVNANTWTTLEFNLPSEPCTNFSGGNSILAAGKGVLEHLVLYGTGGTGAYTVYLDNFEVVTTTNLPATVTMKAGSTLSFTGVGSDPNPGAGLNFSIDGDFATAHTNAVINETNGVFAWMAATNDIGTTNSLTVYVSDSPTNDGVVKVGSQTFSIIVNADAFGPQSAKGSHLVSSGETVTLAWETAPGRSYRVQYKDNADADWTDYGSPVTAEGTTASIVVSNSDQERFYRITLIDEQTSDQ